MVGERLMRIPDKFFRNCVCQTFEKDRLYAKVRKADYDNDKEG